jgi:hypothetical protein
LEKWELDHQAGMHALLEKVLDHLNLTPDNTLQDFYAIHNLIDSSGETSTKSGC